MKQIKPEAEQRSARASRPLRSVALSALILTLPASIAVGCAVQAAAVDPDEDPSASVATALDPAHRQLGRDMLAVDLNRDGIDELLVTAPDEAAGVVYRYHSGVSGSSFEQDEPCRIDQREFGGAVEPGDGFGWALAAGDLNGDGNVDLVAGAPFEDRESTGRTDVGTVCFWLNDGTGVGIGEGCLFQSSPESGDHAGYAVAVGDFNCDGRADIAMGAPGEDYGTSKPDTGAVTVFYTGPDGRPGSGGMSVLWQRNGSLPEPSDQFGKALAAGDFDGNGCVDLAVGAPTETYNGVPSTGMIHVYRGSSSGLSSSNNYPLAPTQFGVGTEAGAKLGSTLAVGNFNDDEYDDLVLSAPGHEVDGKARAGAVWVVFGSAIGAAPADKFKLVGHPRSYDQFGRALAVGNFNDDDYLDLAIGIPNRDYAYRYDAGAVYVVTGSETGLGAPSYLLYQNHRDPGDYFGRSIAFGAFVEGGRGIAMGAPGEDTEAGVNAGQVTVKMLDSGQQVQLFAEQASECPRVPCGDDNICTWNHYSETMQQCTSMSVGCVGQSRSFCFAYDEPVSPMIGRAYQDMDGDGVRDDAEYYLAEYFRPFLRFDSGEEDTQLHRYDLEGNDLGPEPITLFKVSPCGPDNEFLKITYGMLWRRDGGWQPGICSEGVPAPYDDYLAHAGDTQSLRVYLRRNTTGLRECYEMIYSDNQDDNDWCIPELTSDYSCEHRDDYLHDGRPQIYFTQAKHHQYSDYDWEHCRRHQSSCKGPFCRYERADGAFDSPPGQPELNGRRDIRSCESYRGGSAYGPGIVRGNNVGEGADDDPDYFVQDLAACSYRNEGGAWEQHVPFCGGDQPRNCYGSPADPVGKMFTGQCFDFSSLD